jgi:hypothetical protein
VRDGRGVDQLVLFDASQLRAHEPPMSTSAATYRHLLLREDDGAVLAPDTDGHYVCSRDCLEGIFDLVQTAIVGEDGNVSVVSAGRHDDVMEALAGNNLVVSGSVSGSGDAMGGLRCRCVEELSWGCWQVVVDGRAGDGSLGDAASRRVSMSLPGASEAAVWQGRPSWLVPRRLLLA